MKVNINQLKHGMIIKTNNQVYYVIEIDIDYIKKYFPNISNISDIHYGFYGLTGLKQNSSDLNDIRNYKSMYSLKTNFITIEDDIELIDNSINSDTQLSNVIKTLLN